MRESRFTADQIAFALKEAQTGIPKVTVPPPLKLDSPDDVSATMPSSGVDCAAFPTFITCAL